MKPLAIRYLASALWLTGATAAVLAQDVVVSPDTTIAFSNGVVTQDESVVEVTSGPPNLVDLGPLPASAQVESYHFEGGSVFFTLDTITALSEGETTLLVEPRDVVKLDSGTYGISFLGASAGIPRGVGIDALTVVNDRLVMSFDTSVDLGGLIVHDEDLVMEAAGGLVLFLDGSASGVDPSLDLDAAHVLDSGGIVMSFDGHGSIDGVIFADEDALLLEAGDWQRYVTGIDLDDEFAASDLNAFFVLPPPTDPGLIFMDGFESGDTSAWSGSIPVE